MISDGLFYSVCIGFLSYLETYKNIQPPNPNLILKIHLTFIKCVIICL